MSKFAGFCCDCTDYVVSFKSLFCVNRDVKRPQSLKYQCHLAFHCIRHCFAVCFVLLIFFNAKSLVADVKCDADCIQFEVFVFQQVKNSFKKSKNSPGRLFIRCFHPRSFQRKVASERECVSVDEY